MSYSAAVHVQVGFRWQGAWGALVPYVIGDGVEHGGTGYVAIAPNTGIEPPNAAAWMVLTVSVPGLNPRGDWELEVLYEKRDSAFYPPAGQSFIAIAPNSGKEPSAHPEFWQVLVEKADKGDPGEPGYPTPPVQDGAYRLICTVTEGVPVLSWELNQQ